MNPKIKNELGNRCGHIVIIEYIGTRSGKAYWQYRCDCGNIRAISGENFRSGIIKSCGCRHGGPKDDHAFRQLLNQYRQNAKNRQLVFNLSDVELRNLTKQNCHYCGAPPTNCYHPTHISDKMNNADYIYNGLDRVNNKDGYTIDNVVPACKMCNRAKRDMEYESFVNWLETISHFRTSLPSKGRR